MNRMGFISRLLGRQQEAGGALTSSRTVHPASKRQQPSSPPSGSFAQDCFGSRGSPAAVVKIQNPQPAADPAELDSDEEDTIIRIPGSACERNSSMGRRRQAIDICPASVQRLADKVAVLESSHLRASLDGDDGGVTRAEVEELYTDMQLIHRGRSSLVYRAREVRTGHRVILKAYDSARMTSTKRSNLERHVRALKAAVCLLGPHGGAVALERVVENPSGIYLVMQACNGGTLIEAIANAGGKLPERQVAMKVALPLLSALSTLHDRGIVHRDIKPEHLLIDNGQLRIGDFGNASCMTVEAASLAVAGFGSCQSQQQQADLLTLHGAVDVQVEKQQHAGNTVSVTVAACGSGSSVSSEQAGTVQLDAMNFRTGSIEYMAPEMLDKPTAAEVFHLVIAKGIDEDDLPCYDEKVDIWSLGVVLYEALTGLQPFLADGPADMAAAISAKLNTSSSSSSSGQQQQQVFPQFIDRMPCSVEGKEFVAACLSWDARQRPTAQQLLQHPWLKLMQDQAESAKASRAASRRLSMAMHKESSTCGAVSVAAAAAAAVAAAAVESCGPAAGASVAASAAVSKRCSANAATRGSCADQPAGSTDTSAERLVDDLLVGALRALPDASLAGLTEINAASLEPPPLARSQTAANLELGVQNILRSSTSTRLQHSGHLATRVHAP